jgi:hypothetical protein
VKNNQVLFDPNIGRGIAASTANSCRKVTEIIQLAERKRVMLSMLVRKSRMKYFLFFE